MRRPQSGSNKPMRDRLGLGGEAVSKTFETYLPDLQPPKYRAGLRKALETAQSFLDNPRTLVFYGPNGVGKSHLATAIGNALLDKFGPMSAPVYFIQFDDALAQLRATFQNGYEGMGEGYYMDRWRGIPVLILDDVGQAGRERPTGDGEFSRRIGYDIVNGRYRAGNKPMIITTNKAPGELGLWITDSAVSRLFEMGEWVKMEGEDWRINPQQTFKRT